MVIPSPFVYWAQTESAVTLKIDLKNVEGPDLKVLENNVKFTAQGIGARGQSQYEFTLNLYSQIKTGDGDSDTPVMRVFDNRVELALQKENPSWWPRLTAQPQKPAWLKINFDLWKSEDLQDSDDEKRDIMQDYPGMYDRLHKEEMGYRKEDWKKVYLIIYNLFQMVGFTYVMAVISIRYSKHGYDSVTDTYEHVGSAIKFLHLMQILEILHPLFGYVKGSVGMTFVQVMGRNFIIFAMIEGEPRIQTKPVIFYLYIVWSVIEVVRYPFYITQLYKKEIYLLTWLRYSMWLPLYPLGVLCETVIIVRNIPYFEETQRFTVSLPNEWNFAFHLPSFLKVYVFLLAVPGLYFLMSHMRKLRMVKLKPKIIIKKSK